MKIFDCFTFFNELDLLELRFETLGSVVDYFVIVEANKTFSGKDKEFIFEKNKSRFEKWIDKVIYVKVEDMPEYNPKDLWGLEFFQRNAIYRGLVDIAQPGDKILVSDCDEIPNPDTLMANIDRHDMITFRQTLFYYYVNNASLGRWCGTVMAEWGSFDKRIQTLRWFAIKNRYQRWVDYIIENGGWHYSYLSGGKPERIIEKIDSFSDINLRGMAGDVKTIESKMNNSKDLYNRDIKGRHKQHLVDISNNKPKYLDEWLKKYPHYFYET